MTTFAETRNRASRQHVERTPLLPAWRCICCGGVLGRKMPGRLEIRFSRGHSYYATLPVTARCRTCKTMNELISSSGR
jgi:hypothetical protein